MHKPSSTTRRDFMQKIELRDGRALAYIECGDPKGTPVFHFHGHPGSRLEALLAAKPAEKAGVRLIGVDRPGMGYSEFKLGRRLLDWPDDVTQLADALRIDRFAVEGISGGGPYAIACAYKIAERLTACGIVAGLGPIYLLGTKGMMLANVFQFSIARYSPWLLRPLWWLTKGRHRRLMDDDEKVQVLASRLLRMLATVPRCMQLAPELAPLYIRDMLEAFQQGSQSVAYDAELFIQPWGFDLKDISFDRVYLWHGEQDIHVPISMGRFMSAKIAGCKATFYSDEDHVLTAFDHLEEVMCRMALCEE